jgi:hypothetical protein
LLGLLARRTGPTQTVTTAGLVVVILGVAFVTVE